MRFPDRVFLKLVERLYNLTESLHGGKTYVEIVVAAVTLMGAIVFKWEIFRILLQIKIGQYPPFDFREAKDDTIIFTMSSVSNLSPLASLFISQFDEKNLPDQEKKISVNPVVSEVASWYEKIRNVMEYSNNEALLRVVIERILRRRLLFGGKKGNIAAPLIRELVWGRYLPDNTIPEDLVKQVAERIDLYIEVYNKTVAHRRISKNTVSNWIIEIMSADIACLLHPNKDTELINNLIFHLLKGKIIFADDTEEARDVQVFIAIHRAFGKEDLPTIRYHLFVQLFGRLDRKNINQVCDNFQSGYTRIEHSLNHPLKDAVYAYINKQTPPFYILREILQEHRGANHDLVENEEHLAVVVAQKCSQSYEGISEKVKRAIVRSVVFLLLTKAVIALAIEGSFESIVYGKVVWGSISVNILVPPLLMVFASLYIKTPSKDNTARIWERIRSALYDQKYRFGETLTLEIRGKENFALELAVKALWLLAYIVSFGVVLFILNKSHLNIISQIIFVFFIAIISFLAYRINQTARMYTIDVNKQSVRLILFDFFFMPFIHAGRKLTVGVSQLNLFLFFIDCIIEAPFKGFFAFLEEFFLFLNTQHEKLD